VNEIPKCDIQMRTIEQYFPVVLFIMLYKVIPILSLWMKFLSVTIQMRAIEQYFPLVLFIVLYKAILILRLWIKF